MDQDHIPGDNVVECYLRHELTPEERSRLEAHLVDCEECRDRVLLAEMFHVRNGLVVQTKPAAEEVEEEQTKPTVEIFFGQTPYQQYRVTPLPKRARFVAGLEPWQIWLILTVAALLLVLIPTSYFVLTGQ
jgi:hypothetical protein